MLHAAPLHTRSCQLLSSTLDACISAAASHCSPSLCICMDKDSHVLNPASPTHLMYV